MKELVFEPFTDTDLTGYTGCEGDPVICHPVYTRTYGVDVIIDATGLHVHFCNLLAKRECGEFPDAWASLDGSDFTEYAAKKLLYGVNWFSMKAACSYLATLGFKGEYPS